MPNLEGPPFDGKPCPMCPLPNRELSAVAFNFVLITVKLGSALFDEGRAMRKLRELQDMVDRCAEQTWNDPRVAELYVAARYVCQTAWPAGKPAPVQWDAVRPIIWAQLAPASDVVHGLSNAHFANPEHSHAHHVSQIFDPST